MFGLDGVLVANGGRVFGQGNSRVSSCPLMDDRHKCVCVCVCWWASEHSILCLISALDLGSGHRFAYLLFCLRGKYSPGTHLIGLSGFGGGILESVITLQLMEGVLMGEIIMPLKWEHDHELSSKNFGVDPVITFERTLNLIKSSNPLQLEFLRN